MLQFSTSLRSESEAQLQSILSQSNDPLVYAQQAIRQLQTAMETLRSFTIKYKFKNREEEIHFFREVKPKLASELIYYSQVYHLATTKPLGTAKIVRKHFAKELGKINRFSKQYGGFYNYYRSGSNSLDHLCFVRGSNDFALAPKNVYYHADPEFSTLHDTTVAHILANERLIQYLNAEITALSNHGLTNPAKKIKWTGSKVALVELVYALHSVGTLNDGMAGLQETITLFENMFNISLGQFHRTFLEIRGRKSERAKFLNVLSEVLVARMDDADEK